MRAGTVRLRATLLAVALCLLCLPGGLAVAAPARASGAAGVGAAAPPAEDRGSPARGLPEGTVDVGGPVDVEVERVGGSADAVLRRGEALALRLRVTDSSGAALRGLRVLVSASSRPLTTSAALQRWAEGEGPSRGDQVLEDVGLADLPGPSPLPPAPSGTGPGQHGALQGSGAGPVVVDVSADPEQTRRLGPAWGPRGLTVEVVDAEGTRLAAQRTFVTWLPSGDPAQVGRVALVVPLSAGAPDIASAAVPPQRLVGLTAPGGRLERVLGVAALPWVSWAVDPLALGGPPSPQGVQTAAPGADPQAPPAASADQQAALAAWRERVVAAARGRDVALLPSGSPDVAGLAAAGADELYALAGERAAAQAGALGASTALTRTSETALDAAAVRTAARAGRDVVLLATGGGPVDPRSGDGAVRVDLRARASSERSTAAAVRALVPSANATRVLVEGTGQGGSDEQQDGRRDVPRPAPAMTSARLVAESAVAALAPAAGDRHGTLLMAPPPTWDVDPSVAGAVLAPVAAAPWVRTVGLDALAASPGEPRAAAAASAQPGQLPAEGLVAVQAALARARAGAAALSAPGGYLEASTASAVAATSSAWRDDLGTWEQGVAAFSRSSSRVGALVRVVPGSTVTVLASKVDLPVTVVNGFDRAVDVTVSLDSSSGRLQGAGAVPILALAPGDRQRVLVPVTAVASGDVRAQVVLRARDGTRIGAPVPLSVVVRADWEDRGTVVAAAVVALVLVVGVVRTVRRNRGARRGRHGEGLRGHGRGRRLDGAGTVAALPPPDEAVVAAGPGDAAGTDGVRATGGTAGALSAAGPAGRRRR